MEKRHQNPKNKKGKKDWNKRMPLSIRSAAFYPTMPKNMKVALPWNYLTTFSTVTAASKITIGMVELLANTPAYLTELYTIYKYSKISAVEVDIQFVNTGNVAVTFAMGSLPQEDISTTTLPDLIERPGSVFKVTGGSSAYNIARLRHSYDVKRETGHSTPDKDFWMTAAQAASGTVRNPANPAILIAAQATDGVSSYSIVLDVKVTFHLEFFALERPT